jgi:hypothetical protein
LSGKNKEVEETNNREQNIDNEQATPPKKTRKASAPKPPKVDWHKRLDTISKIIGNFVAILAFVVATLSFAFTAYNVYLSRKNIEIVERNFRRDLPTEFSISFKPEKYIEKITLLNISRNDAIVSKAEFKFYYVFSDYRVLTRQQVKSLIVKDSKLNEKFKLARLDNIDASLGDRRVFENIEMSAEEEQVITDFLSSTIDNALRISQLLGSELIVRVKLDFKVKDSLKTSSQSYYIWIHGDKPFQTVGREQFTRENLKDVVGGKRIIDSIVQFEENSKEVIFSEIDESFSKQP